MFMVFLGVAFQHHSMAIHVHGSNIQTDTQAAQRCMHYMVRSTTIIIDGVGCVRTICIRVWCGVGVLRYLSLYTAITV
jgi:hypothetical protein